MVITPRSGGVGKAFTAADAVTKSISLGTAIAIPLVIVLFVIFAFAIFIVCKRRKDKAKKAKQEPDEAYDSLAANQSGSKPESDRYAKSGWDSDEEAEMKPQAPKTQHLPLEFSFYTPQPSPGTSRRQLV